MIYSVHTAGNHRRRDGLKPSKLVKTVCNVNRMTCPILRKNNIEVEGQIFPWTARRGEHQTELAHVGIISEDGHPRVRRLLELREVLVEPRKKRRSHTVHRRGGAPYI
jgi:hypothetical protein